MGLDGWVAHGEGGDGEHGEEEGCVIEMHFSDFAFC